MAFVAVHSRGKELTSNVFGVVDANQVSPSDSSLFLLSFELSVYILGVVGHEAVVMPFMHMIV